MPVAMLIDNPEGSRELYEALCVELQLDRPLGGAVHIAGPSPTGGWRVLEVWNSVEEASQFIEQRFAPALGSLGFAGRPPQPQLWPVHRILTSTGQHTTPTIGGVRDAQH